MTDRKEDVRSDVVNLAEWKRNRDAPARPEARVMNPPRVIEHDPEKPLVVAYIDDLLEYGDLTPIERRRLGEALLPLNDIVGPLEGNTIAMVRREMDEPNPPPQELSEAEMRLWDEAHESPIPGFDHNLACGNFIITLEEDPEQAVHFFPGCKQEVKPYVPHWLRKAQLFFYIVLRMYRYQYDVNAVIAAEQTRTQQDWRNHNWVWRLFHRRPK